jgi:hypothetical protein
MAWAAIEDVESHVGQTADERMTAALDASLAWCNRQRPDLDPDGIVEADITRAVVIYAALLWRERATPQGFATYDAMDNTFTDQSAMMNVYRLLGTRKPVAR